MRLGFEDAKKPTLEQTGDLIGLTRERVRQLKKVIKARAAEYPTRPYLPQIDKALHVLRANAPTSCDAAAHDLSAIDSRSLHPAAVLRTAEFFARKPGVEIVAVESECLVVPKDKLESFERAPVILSEARKQQKRYGASNLQQLRWGLEEKGVVVEETDLEQVLDVASSAHLESGWFWFSVKGLRNTLVTTGRKMLSVNSPLSIASMREGLRRRAAFRQRDVVPPKAILRLLFQRSPHFELVGDGADPMVASTEELDPAKELGSVQLTIVRILQKAPNGILDRETLMKRCHEAGINLSSASVYTTYGACIEHIAPNVWAARGSRVTPGVLESFIEAHGGHRRPDRSTGWLDDGRPWFAFEINATLLGSPAMPTPKDLKALLHGRD